MIANRSVPADRVLPQIYYPDVAEAIAWLSNAFGFVEHYRHGDPISGAQVRAGNAWIMLKKMAPEFRTPLELGFGTQILTIFMEDLETHFARAKAAGVTLVEDLHETLYGELQYAARDLAGHHWLFSRHACDVEPSQWGTVLTVGSGLAGAAEFSAGGSVPDVSK